MNTFPLTGKNMTVQLLHGNSFENSESQQPFLLIYQHVFTDWICMYHWLSHKYVLKNQQKLSLIESVIIADSDLENRLSFN